MSDSTILKNNDSKETSTLFPWGRGKGRWAVVLFNLGGPDSLDSVQPFLENLFNDPDIFKLPFQKSLARFISKKRAPKVVEEYRLIGGSSPINCWTELQQKNLETKLR
ncbi:MAG: hypothetical protein C4539_02260, partial [Ignavibacteriales bacterium]